MTKTMKIVAVIAGVVFAAAAADAQTLTPQPENGGYVTFGVGGQPQKRSFGSSGTFSSFGETGRYEVNQNIGSGFLWDAGGGYMFSKHLGAGASVWMTRSKTAISAAASIPDPVFFGRFTTVNVAGGDDQNASTLGINLDVTYLMQLDEKLSLAVSLGPTIMHTSVDVGSVTVTPNSQTVTLSSASQSKTTAKAGNIGAHLFYSVNEMYSLGAFIRYAAGEADLTTVKKLKVGGLQAGGAILYRF